MSSESVVSRILSLSKSAYDWWSLVLPKEYWDRTAELLRLWQDDQAKTSVLAISWVPWWWKWLTLKEFAYGLKVRIKQSFDKWMIIWDRHTDTNTHVLYVNLDAFFKAIWQMRRGEMLISLNDFLDLFYDDKKALNFLKQYLENSQWFDFEEKVYLKTALERAQGEALSILRVNPRKKKDKSLIMLDWLNAHTMADDLQKADFTDDDALNVIKMMILPRLELSFSRLVKRDSVLSNDWKEIAEVVRFRLKELFYVFNQFTLPSLMRDDLIYVDMTEQTDYKLTKDEIAETITALKTCRDELLDDTSLTSMDWFERYLMDYVDHLLAYFEDAIKFKKYSIPRARKLEQEELKQKKKERKQEIEDHQNAKW